MYRVYDILKKVTCSDKGIKLPYIDNTKDILFKKHGYHTGVDIYGSAAYSISSGVVVAVGKGYSGYVITIQYDSNTILRYMNLTSVDVKIHDIVQPLSKIGEAKSFVHFESAIKINYNMKNPVRVGVNTYYKCNPIDIL